MAFDIYSKIYGGSESRLKYRKTIKGKVEDGFFNYIEGSLFDPVPMPITVKKWFGGKDKKTPCIDKTKSEKFLWVFDREYMEFVDNGTDLIQYLPDPGPSSNQKVYQSIKEDIMRKDLTNNRPTKDLTNIQILALAVIGLLIIASMIISNNDYQSLQAQQAPYAHQVAINNQTFAACINTNRGLNETLKNNTAVIAGDVNFQRAYISATALAHP